MPRVIEQNERRWPALVAALAVIGMHLAVPGSLAIRPPWLEGLVVGGLLVPTLITHHRGQHRWNQILGQTVAATMTAFMVWSLILLVRALAAHTEAPPDMLRSAVVLWVTNVLVFALWYWRLDGGGPHQRATDGTEPGAFLFPQMNLSGSPDGEKWSPIFVDYLFLAFNTSTAFSPTDTAVLSRWAKILTMAQASISLAIVVLLAARAVNIM
jgi:hypothetical protein